MAHQWFMHVILKHTSSIQAPVSVISYIGSGRWRVIGDVAADDNTGSRVCAASFAHRSCEQLSRRRLVVVVCRIGPEVS